MLLFERVGVQIMLLWNNLSCNYRVALVKQGPVSGVQYKGSNGETSFVHQGTVCG